MPGPYICTSSYPSYSAISKLPLAFFSREQWMTKVLTKTIGSKFFFEHLGNNSSSFPPNNVDFSISQTA